MPKPRNEEELAYGEVENLDEDAIAELQEEDFRDTYEGYRSYESFENGGW